MKPTWFTKKEPGNAFGSVFGRMPPAGRSGNVLPGASGMARVRAASAWAPLPTYKRSHLPSCDQTGKQGASVHISRGGPPFNGKAPMNNCESPGGATMVTTQSRDGEK